MTPNNITNNIDNNISIIKPKKTEKVFSEDVINCLDECLKYFPENLIPKNKTTALKTISDLNKIDKIPFEEIIKVVQKTRSDDFWSKNFLSINKLRKNNPEGLKYIVVFNEKIKTTPNNSGKNKIDAATLKSIENAKQAFGL